MSKAVTGVEKSSNSKIGPISTTYVSQVSCPSSCPFKESGCYAEAGFVAITTNRLNKEAWAKNYSIVDLAKQEADEIDKLSGRRLLRLHVVGDCTTDQTAMIVSEASRRYSSRGGNFVWTYTHGWRDVNRDSWQNVSVLASVETISDAKIAMEKGYAAALVVAQQEKRVVIQEGIKLIPCPKQLNKTKNCSTCKLCTKDKWLKESKSVITFSSHSSGKTKIDNKLLTILQ